MTDRRLCDSVGSSDGREICTGEEYLDHFIRSFNSFTQLTEQQALRFYMLSSLDRLHLELFCINKFGKASRIATDGADPLAVLRLQISIILGPSKP